MRLSKVSVRGLFGLFDHDVALRLNDRITILHAPNGYGKTVLLKLVSAFFGGSLLTFRKVEFESFTLHFSNKTKVVITQSDLEQIDLPHRNPNYFRSYSITLSSRGNDDLRWSPDERQSNRDDSGRILERTIAPSAIDSYVPELRRIAPREWRDPSGDRLTFFEVMERYWTRFPPSVRRQGPIPDWLQSIRDSIHCQLIETQRLMVQKKEARPPSEQSLEPAVKSYSDALAQKISRVLADSATISQSLDSSFPRRVLSRMESGARYLPEAQIRQKLKDLEQKRARLTRADLLDISDEGEVLSHDVFSDPTLRIMTEYVEDAEKKLAVFDDILGRIELFVDLLNSRFTFKKVSANRECGFILTDRSGQKLEANSLSSGEQHELIMVYHLIFDTRPNTLILIDEPEISLHIAWQKKFLSDLRQIIQLAPVDVVLATHSPQIIGSNLDLTVQLKGPKRG